MAIYEYTNITGNENLEYIRKGIECGSMTNKDYISINLNSVLKFEFNGDLSIDDKNILDTIVTNSDGAVLNRYYYKCNDCNIYVGHYCVNSPEFCAFCTGINITDITQNEPFLMNAISQDGTYFNFHVKNDGTLIIAKDNDMNT